MHAILLAALLAAAPLPPAHPPVSGDTATASVASAAWYANADGIATFLGAANPRNWPVASLRSAMRMHLDLMLKAATARLHGDWAADIAAYDEVHQHTLQMADVLSDGIIKQFPNRFN